MFVFDLDGVVTDPRDGNVVSAEVMARVANELSKGKPVAFNTGRSHVWVEENILPVLKCSPSDLSHLLLVAEMGSVVGTFRSGKLKIEKDQELSLPTEFIRAVEELIAKKQSDGTSYTDVMYWDASKVTMGSLEKKTHVSIADYDHAREKFHPELNALIDEHGLDEFKIGVSIIATDVMHRSTGKHKGAERVLEWLDDRGEKPEIIYTFGDSVSDSAMAEEFSRAGKSTIFVFVGDVKHADKLPKGKHRTVVMQGRHSSDTAAYLSGVE